MTLDIEWIDNLNYLIHENLVQKHFFSLFFWFDPKEPSQKVSGQDTAKLLPHKAGHWPAATFCLALGFLYAFFRKSISTRKRILKTTADTQRTQKNRTLYDLQRENSKIRASLLTSQTVPCQPKRLSDPSFVVKKRYSNQKWPVQDLSLPQAWAWLFQKP